MNRRLAQAVTLYESFREKRPKRLAKLRVDIPKVVACMGHVEALDYRTTHGKKVTLYHHNFAAGSRPLLCVSANGRQLMLLGGRYEFTGRGIVDQDAAGREIETARRKFYQPPKKLRRIKRWIRNPATAQEFAGMSINPKPRRPYQRGDFKMMDLPDDGTITFSRKGPGLPWIVTRTDARGNKVGKSRRFATLKKAGEYAWPIKLALADKLYKSASNPTGAREFAAMSIARLTKYIQEAHNRQDHERERAGYRELIRRERRTQAKRT